MRVVNLFFSTAITNKKFNGEKMKTIITVLLLLVVSIASNAQTLDGSWKGKFSGPNGDMDLVFTFKVNADTLNGDVTSEMGSLPIENGKINGNELSFDVNVNGQVISHTGVLDGDTVKLSMPFGDQVMKLSRVKEESKINGKWIGNISSPQGEMELTFTFKVDGDKLTGSDTSPMGETELSNGVVNGNDFSFDVDTGGMVIQHKCKYLDDDTIDVIANVMDQEINMKLTRTTQ
jgi:hypothetical protein